jgi:hypothetical protein
MESTLDSGSYWILQGILVILMLIGKLLLLISHDIPPSAKCYPPVAGILASGEKFADYLGVAWDLGYGASLMSSVFYRNLDVLLPQEPQNSGMSLVRTGN